MVLLPLMGDWNRLHDDMRKEELQLTTPNGRLKRVIGSTTQRKNNTYYP